MIGVVGNMLLGALRPDWQLAGSHLVRVPVAGSPSAFIGQFQLPDFGAIGLGAVWTTALTLAIVASLESLLSVKAVDELDPRRRTTDKNWELMAQGGGNIVSGLLGGLPVTSVIVRSLANVDAGAESKLSTMLHATWLLLSVALIPVVLNQIPLAALAAVLIATGYKLCKPKLFTERYKQVESVHSLHRHHPGDFAHRPADRYSGRAGRRLRLRRGAQLPPGADLRLRRRGLPDPCAAQPVLHPQI